jgi:hypothetical protein
MKNKKTEILIETHERTLVRWLEKEVRSVCRACRAEALFILPERAAVETGASVREIFRLVESGAVHFIETDNRLTLICRTSLSIESPDALESDTFLMISTKSVDNAPEID